MLVLLIDRLGDLSLGELLDALLEARWNLGLLPLHLLGAIDLLEQIFLRLDQITKTLLRDGEGLDDVLLAHLEGPAFHHYDRIG